MRNFRRNLQIKASYVRLVCLCVVYLIASLQSIGTAGELEGLVVYFAFEENAGKTVADLSGTDEGWEIGGRYVMDGW